MREWARSILTSLPVLAVKLDEEELAGALRRGGQERFRESVPLHESIRSLHHLKRKLIVFVRGECFPQNAVDLYAQLEFEQRTNLFFDQLLYHVARGHDEARQASTWQLSRQVTRPTARPSRGLWLPSLTDTPTLCFIRWAVPLSSAIMSSSACMVHSTHLT